MSNQASHTALAHILNQMVANRQTGTLFLKGDDGHAYAVACQAGAIVGVWSGATMGNAAVEKLCGVEQASCRFSPAVVTPQSSKPDSAYVFRLLGTGGSEARPNAPGSSRSAPEALEFHERALSAARKNLLNVLGPFATHILDDALRSWSEASLSAENIENFLSMLAAEIDDDDRARHFVRTTLSELGPKLAVSSQ